MLNEQDREKINRHLDKLMGVCLRGEGCDCSPREYCSDESPRALLNGVVAKVADDAGTLKLGEELNVDRPKMTVGELKSTPLDWHFYIGLSSLARMTAEHIALALYRASGGEDL